MSLTEQFKTIINFFNKELFDYALIGALALHAYGYTRATKDIDLITRLKYQEMIIKYLENLGFETLSKSKGYSTHVHHLDLTRFDFVYVDDETAEKIFQAAVKKTVLSDFTLPVACAEHLILMKLFALKNDPDRKYKELADIKELFQRVDIDPKIITRTDFEKVDLEHFYDEIMAAGNV